MSNPWHVRVQDIGRTTPSRSYMSAQLNPIDGEQPNDASNPTPPQPQVKRCLPDDTHEKTKKPRCRNELCDALAHLHPLKHDKHVTFKKGPHAYSVDEKPVTNTATKIVHDQFEQFNAEAIINKSFASWKQRANSKYWDIIQGCTTDEEAKALIAASWKDKGLEASQLGTKFHLYCEQRQNGLSETCHGADIKTECRQYEDFMKSKFVKDRDLTPYRTELSVYSYRDGIPVCAGQIDSLMKDRDGNYYIFDWKRVAPKPYETLTCDDKPFRGKSGLHGSCQMIPDTKFHKYSLQTSLYSIMLRESAGIDVCNNLYLLRVHKDMPPRSNGETFQLIHCHDWRSVAQELLDCEFQRLVKERASELSK